MLLQLAFPIEQNGTILKNTTDHTSQQSTLPYIEKIVRDRIIA